MNVKGSEKSRAQNTEHRTQTDNPPSPPFAKGEGFETFSEELRGLREDNLFREFTCIELSPGSKISIKGEMFLNFSSNDYLNLSSNPEIVKAAINALKKYGLGSGASRLLSGTYASHKKLEERIAEFKSTQAAIVFNTGYAANTGIIPAIAGADAVIFSDELNHASIVDGTRLSKAGVKIYRHRDINHLESLLKKSFKSKSVKRRLIITETVFSMDGDIAPLNDLVSISRKYDALLMVDDAHGMGTLGKTGRGGLEHFGIKPDGIIQMGTLSKGAGCYGAFVAGKKDLINLLINRARSFIYSTSLPPAVCEAGIKAIDIIDSRSINSRKRLWKNRDRLYQGLKSLGYDTLDSETPIIPLLAGNVKDTLKMGRYLYRNKILAPAIRPPTVPEEKCRIRLSVTAGHTDEDIDLVLEILGRP
ncbi:MAG TPA: 8-amino-7-oxononanoate synthase [Nitrospirae bacterium]|nr:8-amino-7-oxononanoate synthase [Nitrospirota bacterium]